MNTPLPTLENLYDTYSPMLYGIALEISPGQKEAEEILISTFHKIGKQNLLQQAHPSLCATLIKLIIRTAHEQLKPGQLKNNFRLKQFESTPLLHKLLCEQISLENYGDENKLARAEVAKRIREEFISLRNLKKKDVAFPFPATQTQKTQKA